MITALWRTGLGHHLDGRDHRRRAAFFAGTPVAADGYRRISAAFDERRVSQTRVMSACHGRHPPVTVAISSPSLRQQRICDSPSGSRGLSPLAARRERDAPDIAGRCVHRDTGLPLPPAERRTIRHGPARALSNRLATRPAVCRNGRPNRTFRVKADLDRTLREGPRRSQDGKVSGGPRLPTALARQLMPGSNRTARDPPASWRCVTGRPAGRTRPGGRWRRQAHQPTDRIRKVKPHNRYGQQRRLADEKQFASISLRPTGPISRRRAKV